MANIVLTQYVNFKWPVDFDSIELLFEAADDGNGSATSRTVVGPGYFIEVEGIDLELDGNGALLSGTITAYRYYVGGNILLAISGADYDVATARYAYENDEIFYFIRVTDTLNFDASLVAADENGWGIGLFGGTNSSDTLKGSAGAEELFGGDGDDLIYGGGGAYDILYGGAGNDTLYAGDGDDYLSGGPGRDLLDGGGGWDIAYYWENTRKIEVKLNGANDVSVKVNGVIEDTIRNIEGIVGGSAGDRLTGDSLDNYFQGEGGKDTIDGGGGFDIASYSEKTKKIEVTLNGNKTVTVKVGGKAEDKIKSIEGVYGGSGSDRITGDSKANYLVGGAGKDTLSGGGGSDTLIGGAGKDVLTGGWGTDYFLFTTRLVASSADTIRDFAANKDAIVISSHLVEALGGTLDASEFRNGKAAKDANDHIIYDRSKGKLYYDADGNGAGKQVLIATLSNKAKIDHEDFLII